MPAPYRLRVVDWKAADEHFRKSGDVPHPDIVDTGVDFDDNDICQRVSQVLDADTFREVEDDERRIRTIAGVVVGNIIDILPEDLNLPVGWGRRGLVVMANEPLFLAIIDEVQRRLPTIV